LSYTPSSPKRPSCLLSRLGPLFLSFGVGARRSTGRAARLFPLADRGYSIIEATTPAPTVRPPSRIAKRRPSSIAIGAIRSTSIVMLSPGITISVPSGSLIEPVTSVVRK